MTIRAAMRKFGITSLILVFGLAEFLAGRVMQAQTSYGAIVGTITDTTGADLDGAQVTLKNNGTNETQTIKAGNGGIYSFLNLNPGT